MILVIFGLIIILGMFLSYKLEDSDLDLLGYVVSTIGWVAIVVSLIVIIIQNIYAPALQLQDQERYQAITYKIDSNIYKDNINLDDQDLIDEIANWNKDVLYYQKIQRNFWVGVYFPNIADGYKLIDYNQVMKEFIWRSEWEKLYPKDVYNLTKNEIGLFKEARKYGTISFEEINMYDFTSSIYVKVNIIRRGSLDWSYLYSDSSAKKYRKELSQSIKILNKKYDYFLKLKNHEDELNYYKDKIVEDISYNDYKDIENFIKECF